MMMLTSRSNPKIKQIHQLLSQRKQRDASGLFVVEGIRHVGEACAAHAGVEYVVYAPQMLTSEFAQKLVQEQAELGVPCYPVDEALFKSLASKETHRVSSPWSINPSYSWMISLYIPCIGVLPW